MELVNPRASEGAADVCDRNVSRCRQFFSVRVDKSRLFQQRIQIVRTTQRGPNWPRPTRARHPHAKATRHVSEPERIGSIARHVCPCRCGSSVHRYVKLTPARRGKAGGPPAGASQSVQADRESVSVSVCVRSRTAAVAIGVPPDVASVPNPSIADDLRRIQSTVRTAILRHPVG